MNEFVVGNRGLRALTDGWWTLIVRGIGAMLFGVLTLTAPGLSLLALVMLWGTYAFVDGVFALAHAFQRGREGMPWGWFVVSGLVSIAAGIATFATPGITGLVLLGIVAIWAIARGGVEVMAALGLRRVLRSDAWMLGLSGVTAIAFGILVIAAPQTGALALAWLIGGYATLFGALLIGFGMRLHSLRSEVRGYGAGGTPTHA